MDKLNVNEKMMSIADVCDIFSCVTAFPAYIMDVRTREIVYVSSYPYFIGGYSAPEAKMREKNFFMEVCVPDDREFLSGVLPALLDFYRTHSAELKHYSATFNCGMITKDSCHKLLNHQLSPLVLDSKGDVTHILGVVSPGIESHGRMLVVRDVTGILRWSYDFNARKWIDYSEVMLNYMEKLVMFYTCNGLSISEISDKINKSEDMVKNIRRNVFKKLKVNNIVESIMTILTHKLM